MVRQKRGTLTLPEFAELVGLSYVTIWKIEAEEQPNPRLGTIAALAPHLGLSTEELLGICTSSNVPTPPPCRNFLTAEQVLPIIQQLPTDEKRRLRELDLETMSNRDFAEAMEAMAKAYRRRAGL